MANTTIANALNAYGNAAKALSGGGEAATAGGAPESFSDLLKQSAKDAVKTGADSEKLSLAATAGNANVSDLVSAVSSAEVTLQAVTAVRDKVVSAYQEILRMPI
jgi:flagellar hook-basal body complex protein FliE